jgi:hypothetical protein
LDGEREKGQKLCRQLETDGGALLK